MVRPVLLRRRTDWTTENTARSCRVVASISLRSSKMIPVAYSRYAEWNSADIGRKRFVKRTFLWVVGTRFWPNIVSALTIPRLRLRPQRDCGGPVMTTFLAPLIKQMCICLSSGKCVLVISTWCWTWARGRSRTDGMGDGVPPHSLIESYRVLGASEARGYVCWERQPIQKRMVRVSDVIPRNETQSMQMRSRLQ